MKNKKEKNKSIIEKKEDIMNYEAKGKPGKEAREIKQRKRARMLKELNCYWSYASSSSNSKKFRAYKLYHMIYWITLFIQDEQQLFLKDEQSMLLNLINWITLFNIEKSDIEKSAENKKEIIRLLNELEALSEEGIKKQKAEIV